MLVQFRGQKGTRHIGTTMIQAHFTASQRQPQWGHSVHMNLKLISNQISNLTVVTNTRVLHPWLLVNLCNKVCYFRQSSHFPMYVEKKPLFQSSLLKKTLAKDHITFPMFSDCVKNLQLVPSPPLRTNAQLCKPEH